MISFTLLQRVKYQFIYFKNFYNTADAALFLLYANIPQSKLPFIEGMPRNQVNEVSQWFWQVWNVSE